MKNYRIRKLIDGRYVAEVKTGWWIFEGWSAISFSGFTHRDPFYIKMFCICNSDEEAKHRLAEYGISE